MIRRVFCAIWLTLNMLSANAEEVVPIKNVVPQAEELTKQEVIWMYTLRTRFWNDGTRVVVYYLDPNSALHRAFCNTVLGINTDRFEQLVSSYINDGNASYFRRVNTVEDVLYYVSVVPGAIGYIDSMTVVTNNRGTIDEIKITF